MAGGPPLKKVGSFVPNRYLPQYNLSVTGAVESGTSRVVRFGVFEMDLDARELRKGGVRVKLQDQPFRVLAMLVERPGEIVTREDIRETIWAEDTFVEFDHGLNTVVQKIRQALGDSATSPRFLETIPRRGYRFVGTVDKVLSADGQAAAPDSSEDSKAKRRRLAWRIVALGAVVLAALAAGWRFRPGPEITSPLTPTPLTTYPGRENFPTFSPEGERVAFSWEGANRDNWDIYMRLIGEDTLVRLTDHPASDSSPAWSPDGRRIAFVRHDYERDASTVILVPAIGGPEREVWKGPLLQPDTGWLDYYGRHLAWHPDGVHLVASVREKSDSPRQLHLLDADTGDTRELIAAATSWGDVDPAVSPDGSRLAFRRWFSNIAFSVYVVNLTETLQLAGEPRNLTGEMPALSPAWTPDGREILYAFLRTDGRRSLWRVSPEGGPPQPIAQPSIGSVPAFSPSGDRGAFVHFSMNYDTWQLELPGTAAEPLIESTHFDVTPMFSPDGEKIAFSSSRSGYREIWVCDGDGSDPVQLTHLESRQSAAPYWSPDGSQIAFHSYVENQLEVFVMPSGGGEPDRLTDDPAEDVQPTYSRDGRWIYFPSDRSGEERIWKIPAEGGAPLPITSERGVYALESPDGQTLYYSDNRSLWSMPVEGGSRTLVIEGVAGAMNWTVTQDGIFFPDRGTPQELNFYDFESRTVNGLLRLPERIYAGLSASRDGKKILFPVGEPPEADIMLVDEFR